jgi:pimeloyl-ACP methyl ester carboxylesterase
MHFAEMGSGPLVVLCHGFPGSWYSWRHATRLAGSPAPACAVAGRRGRGAISAQATPSLVWSAAVGLLDALGRQA